MNTASNTSKAVPTGAPVAGNSARRAAFQSAGQLGRRFAVTADTTPATSFDKTPVATPAVPLATVLATYSMFRAA